MNSQNVRLSVVMPAYNEASTIRAAIQQVLAVDFPCPVEFVVVDDGSNDETPHVLAEFMPRGVRVMTHPRNLGKGAAVRTGVNHASGTHLIILDADLEYSPADIPAMLEPVLAGRADHVFGTRVFGMNTCFRSFRFAMGGRLLTLAANVLYDSCLTDMHTCLKLIPLDQFRTMTLTENGFGMDTEITARLLRDGVRPFEIPITYAARSIEEGKKIGWRDGVRCMSILAKIRTERRQSRCPPAATAVIEPLVHRHAQVMPQESIPMISVAKPAVGDESSAVIRRRPGGYAVLPAGSGDAAEQRGQREDVQVRGQMLPSHEAVACQCAGQAVQAPRQVGR